jgi:hypothetical protein
MTPIPVAWRRRIDHTMSGGCLRIMLRPHVAEFLCMSRGAEPV